MLCSKIGSDCPHPVGTDDNLIFVMMPFKGFTNVYDAIVQAVQAIDTKQYRLERADTRFTTISIWCDRICKNIRRAKYLIVDTTGKNANVFYELGFSHAMENTKAIIITQNVKDAPFDIADINHVEYSKDDLPDLRAKIKAAITDLDAQEPDESYANKTADEVIIDLNAQLRTEEKRSADFKKELVETEKREKQLKEHIREIEAIQKDPVEEAKKRMVALEGTIGELKAKLKLTEEDKRDTIDQLNKTLQEKEQRLAALEKELQTFKASEDAKPLADTLLDDTKNRSEARKWFSSGNDAYHNGNTEKAVELWSRAIELDPNFPGALYNRGVGYHYLAQYERAIQDYDKVLELSPNDAFAYGGRGTAYYYHRQHDKAIEDLTKSLELLPNCPGALNNRGHVYAARKQYKAAIADYNKCIELEPDHVFAHIGTAELSIMTGKYTEALASIEEALSFAITTAGNAIGTYLNCVATKLLKIDTSQAEKAFSELVQEDFTAYWCLDSIEQWLEEADLDEETRRFIVEKTEMLKKHTR